MKPETKLGRQLQSFNRIAGLTHLIQGVTLALILNDETTIPVITRFFDETSDGVRPVSETLFEFPIAVIAPIFLLLSAAAHLFVSSPQYVLKYERNILNGINPALYLSSAGALDAITRGKWPSSTTHSRRLDRSVEYRGIPASFQPIMA
jgi:hypothetical protein